MKDGLADIEASSMNPRRQFSPRRIVEGRKVKKLNRRKEGVVGSWRSLAGCHITIKKRRERASDEFFDPTRRGR
jgi:hypothetical protein